MCIRGSIRELLTFQPGKAFVLPGAVVTMFSLSHQMCHQPSVIFLLMVTARTCRSSRFVSILSSYLLSIRVVLYNIPTPGCCTRIIFVKCATQPICHQRKQVSLKFVQKVNDKETITLNLVTVNHFFLLQIQ